jgi:thiamine-phosphate pyrophosphorylase
VAVHRRILRTIDANVNRVSEGLRVLEDISRFIVEDTALSQQLKSTRHAISKLAGGLNINLIENRDVPGDIGARSDLTTEHMDLVAVVRANAKRVEEGLRVLEELSKLPELKPGLPAAPLKEYRYQVYSVEKALAARLAQFNKSE